METVELVARALVVGAVLQLVDHPHLGPQELIMSLQPSLNSKLSMKGKRGQPTNGGKELTQMGYPGPLLFLKTNSRSA